MCIRDSYNCSLASVECCGVKRRGGSKQIMMICQNSSLALPSTAVQACTPRHGSSSASSQWHRTGRGDRRLQGVGQRGGHQALPTSVSYRAHQQNRAATSTTATPLNNSAVEPRRSSTRRWRTNGERTITGYSPEPVGHPQPTPATSAIAGQAHGNRVPKDQTLVSG